MITKTDFGIEAGAAFEQIYVVHILLYYITHIFLYHHKHESTPAWLAIMHAFNLVFHDKSRSRLSERRLCGIFTCGE
jgi:hypothetical protein